MNKNTRLKFGDAIINTCASNDNPIKYCYFVRYRDQTDLIECTDKKGNFWCVHMDSIEEYYDENI